MLNNFWMTLTLLKLKRKYIMLAVLYGLSTLIIPLATQYLVNSLTLSSIMLNTFMFLLIILVFLGLTQLFRFNQIILTEYIQREIFVHESFHWKKNISKNKSQYFFEIPNSMKSFASSFSHLVEMCLTLLFGLMVIITFHPAYLVLLGFIVLGMYLIFTSWDKAVLTSVKESDEKYRMYELKSSGLDFLDEHIEGYLEARDEHFYFIKRNKLIIATMFICSHLFLLGTGIYFISSSQISIGQLVSAEIILSGIMASISKLPKTMEGLYDYETSKIKIAKVLQEKVLSE